MPKFTDSKGETWEVEITGGTIRRAQSLLGIDLGKPLEGDPSPLVQFDMDIRFKVDLIFIACMLQADRRSVTDEEFAERLGTTSLQPASEAFKEALQLFFQSLGRTEVVKAMQKQAETLALAVAEATKTIGSEEFAKQVAARIHTLGKPFANSLPAPEPTPSPERFES